MEGKFPDFTFILQCWKLNSGLAHAGKCSIAEFCFSCMILIVMVLFKNVLKIFLGIFLFHIYVSVWISEESRSVKSTAAGLKGGCEPWVLNLNSWPFIESYELLTTEQPLQPENAFDPRKHTLKYTRVKQSDFYKYMAKCQYLVNLNEE